MGEGVAKEQTVQRVRCLTVQNEIRDALERMTASASKRILDPILERDKNLAESCVCYSEDDRGHSERDEEAQVSQ